MGRRVVMAAAAATGGALWVVKAAAVLAGRDQPAHLFEVAPVAFALVALLLALEVPSPRGRRTPLVLAVVAVLSSTLAAAWDLAAGDVLGPAMMLGILAMVGALGVAGRRLRRDDAARRVPRWAVGIAVATVPAIVAGGALSVVTDERALEVPVLLLGLAWIAFAPVLLREPVTTVPVDR